MSSLLALEVIFKKANRKSDDSVTLSFETQAALSTEQFAHVDGFRQKTGHLVFSQDSIKSGDIPKGDTSSEALSPSQDLRRSLYAVWKAKSDSGMITEDWDSYYANAMRGFKRAVDRSHPENN